MCGRWEKLYVGGYFAFMLHMEANRLPCFKGFETLKMCGISLKRPCDSFNPFVLKEMKDVLKDLRLILKEALKNEEQVYRSEDSEVV